MMLLLSKKNAEERVASFLLDISQRYQRRGFSATHFRLPMSRVDIVTTGPGGRNHQPSVPRPKNERSSVQSYPERQRYPMISRD